ncbi:MAG: alpha/beta hydrolase [Anaerolineae bacterium]|nr:alpha/beta hydrolase [Anaerolineae bacterium]
MSAIILESSLVHYEALGRGKPLLFLHDWLGSWRYWVPTMVDMSSSYRAYALDFWGFGDSDKVRAKYTVAGYVGQVALFMDQMGIGKVPLIGHGLGGVVALLFAAQFPERVEQIMTVSTPLMSSHIGSRLMNFGGGDNPAKAILGRRLKSYEEVEMEATKTDSDAVVQSIRSMMTKDIADVLDEIEMPLLLVYGQADPIIQPPDEDIIEDLDYNALSYPFEEAQHYPMLEDTSKFNRLLRDFLMHKDDWDAYNMKSEWRRRIR